MTDPVDTTDAPLAMPPARFFFEIGFFAAHAEAVVTNSKPPFVMSDTLVDHAWDIARDASDDPREFDRYLSRADSADQQLRDAEATYRAFDAANRDADGSREGLAACVRSLRQYGAGLFPADRRGAVHFARVLMDAVATTIEAALTHRAEQGRPITEACGIAMVEVLPVDRDELERGLITQGFPPERAKELAQEQPANDGALQMLARHRLATLASAPAGDALPDIGFDPLKGPRADDRHEAARLRLRAAYAQQQKGVPDQTALVWRYDLGAVLDMAIQLKAILARPRAAVEDVEWLSAQRRLSLAFYSPMYGDDDDQSEEWRVFKETGSINDREWDVIGRGATIAEAVAAARSAETDGGEAR